MKCPHCGTENPEIARFCAGCGASLDQKCPHCGTENPPIARFCAGCGATLGQDAAQDGAPTGTPETVEASAAPSAPTDASADAPGATKASSTPAAPADAPVSAPEAATKTSAAPATGANDADKPTAGAQTDAHADAAGTPASDAAAPASKAAHEAAARLSELLDRAKALPAKTKAIAGGAAAAALALILVLVFALNGGPSKGQIEQDIRSAGLTKYTGGTYSDAGDLNIDSIKITSKQKETVPQLMTGLTGVTGDAYTYMAEVKMSNDDVEATKTVGVSYVKYGGKWTAVTAPSAQSSTFTAKQGPSSDAIAQNATTLLSSTYTGTSNNYSTQYKDGEFNVTKNDVDGNTANVTVHCKKDGAFSTSEGDLNVTFTFDTKTGSWTTDKVTPSDNLAKVDYSKLVGTWKGAFKSQSAYSHKCFGAQSKGFTLKITKVDSNSLKAEGTFSGLAHYHSSSESDENSDAGDSMLSDQKFTIGLTDSNSYSGTQLTGSYKAPENGNGTVSLELTFGGSQNSDKATAELETEPHVDSIFNFSRFTDTYELQKQA